MQTQATLLQCMIGIQCDDFVMLTADQITSQSIVILKNDSDKLLPISDNMILGINGDSADMSQFSQFIAKNLQLYTVKNGYKVCQEAAAHFVRKNLADTIRTNDAYSMNLMLAGYENGHSMLYYIDNLGTSMPVPYACHGFGGIFSTSILDFYHRPNLTEQEGYELLMLCVKEIQKRLFVNLSSFQVKVVNKYGITTLPSI